MRKGLSESERLGLLLVWLNDPINVHLASGKDATRWEADGHRAISDFLSSFDGSAESGHVEVLAAITRVRDPDALQALQVQLQLVMEVGFAAPGNDIGA